jgi:hypothetical protein
MATLLPAFITNMRSLSCPFQNPVPHRGRSLLAVFLVSCALVSGCVQTVKISYPSESEIHPEFDRRYTTWEGERVEVNWTPSLRAESSKYLAQYDRVLLANSIHEKGFRHEYKIAGRVRPWLSTRKTPSTPRKSDTIRQAALRLE